MVINLTSLALNFEPRSLLRAQRLIPLGVLRALRGEIEAFLPSKYAEGKKAGCNFFSCPAYKEYKERE